MNWSCGYQLRIRSGPSRGNTYVVDAPVLKLGRAIRPGERVPGWVRVSDDTVSRLHCELFWQEDRNCFRLLHRSTTNSTYVNGEVVEDVEVFDGDLIEIGATSLEIQKADLRWSKPEDPSVQAWARPKKDSSQLEIETKAITGTHRIPGATVPDRGLPSNRKVSLGATRVRFFESDTGSQYPLVGSRVRFGSNTPPPPPPTPEGEEAKEEPKLHFDAEHEFENQQLSYYNLVLLYDEILQDFKALRLGPDSQTVRVFRKQSGLIWQTELPEQVELPLMEGDHLHIGAITLTYRSQGSPS